jgi:protein-S-isoprenylcysteine O-methyltransferase Ste14
MMKLGWIDVVTFLIYLAFLGFALAVAPHNTLSYAALVLSIVCSAIWFISRWQLGASFSVTAQARHLVTQGIYSKIRHPIYVFGTSAFLFVVLALQGWPALIIWAIVILIQLTRIRREDIVLAETFGAEYADYKKRTWF